MMQIESEARAAVIVLNWNGWKDTIECLASLAHLHHSSYCVIVVDNASNDDSFHQISAWVEDNVGIGGHYNRFVKLKEDELAAFRSPLQPMEILLVKASVNGGYARGNNLGIHLAMQCGATHFWILNNDTVVHQDALCALERVVTNDPTVGIVGSVLLYYDDRTRIQAYGGATFDRYKARGSQIANGLTFDAQTIMSLSSAAPAYISGASTLVTDRFVKDVGVMEEGYFLYYEEIDWAIRSSKRWRLAISPESLVYHKEGASIGTSTRSARSFLSQYYLNRNLLIFYRRFLPWMSAFAVMRVLREVARCVFRGDLGRARVTTRALADGLRGVTGPRA